jgi:hypothetical protein
MVTRNELLARIDRVVVQLAVICSEGVVHLEGTEISELDHHMHELAKTAESFRKPIDDEGDG